MMAQFSFMMAQFSFMMAQFRFMMAQFCFMMADFSFQSLVQKLAAKMDVSQKRDTKPSLTFVCIVVLY